MAFVFSELPRDFRTLEMSSLHPADAIAAQLKECASCKFVVPYDSYTADCGHVLCNLCLTIKPSSGSSSQIPARNESSRCAVCSKEVKVTRLTNFEEAAERGMFKCECGFNGKLHGQAVHVAACNRALNKAYANQKLNSWAKVLTNQTLGDTFNDLDWFSEDCNVDIGADLSKPYNTSGCTDSELDYYTSRDESDGPVLARAPPSGSNTRTKDDYGTMSYSSDWWREYDPRYRSSAYDEYDSRYRSSAYDEYDSRYRPSAYDDFNTRETFRNKGAARRNPSARAVSLFDAIFPSMKPNKANRYKDRTQGPLRFDIRKILKQFHDVETSFY